MYMMYTLNDAPPEVGPLPVPCTLRVLCDAPPAVVPVPCTLSGAPPAHVIVMMARLSRSTCLTSASALALAL